MLYKLEVGKWEFNYQLDQNGHITLLFFTYSESLTLLKQYSEVLLIDCTYKTNRFHIPLLDILGSTGLNYTFFAAFIFLSSEKEENYLYALKILQEVMNVQKIAFPNVIVIDKDKGLMNAICHVFPQSYNLLCSWHINKNVLAYSRELKIHKDSKEEDSFMSQWRALVSSHSVDDYKKRWIEFQKE
jgi:MULE transposase domain